MTRRRPRRRCRLPQRRPERDRLRREHDDAHLPPRRARSARAWGAGDEIVVTELDHHANVAPWTRLAAGARRRASDGEHAIRRRGRSTGRASSATIRPRTKLLAIGAASNALGTVTDVARAASLAHAHGARVFVDAVHYAPHALVDVRALDCDFLACSAYKFYGPHIGILYGRHDLLAELDVREARAGAHAGARPLGDGDAQLRSARRHHGGVDFLASLGDDGAAGDARREKLARAYRAMHERSMSLFGELWDGLAKIRGVKLYGLPPSDAPRAPTAAFTVNGVDSRVVATRLAAEQGVFVSNGNFYAATVAERMGVSGSGWVRAGFACYTTADEVARLVGGVRAISS